MDIAINTHLVSHLCVPGMHPQPVVNHHHPPLRESESVHRSALLFANVQEIKFSKTAPPRRNRDRRDVVSVYEEMDGAIVVDGV